MGNVVPLNKPFLPSSETVETSPTPTTPAKGFSVSEAYEALREKAGLRTRHQQETLSAAVEDAFLKGVPLIAEAPTGTGKTIGYLVGALAAFHKTQTPIVVATATVALQEQLLTGDLPKLVAAGLVSKNEVIVAKGRGRYLCAKAGEKLGGGHTSQTDMFENKETEKAQDLTGLPEMLEQFWAGTWDGDIDRWKQKQPVFWSQIQANADTCTKTKCEFHDKCAFFKARASLFAAKIVVANHDLVLADLAMAAEDVEPVLAFPNYNLIFDEAHHLPDKAMEQGRASVEMERMDKALLAIPAWLEAVQKHPVVAKILDKTVDAGALENTSAVQSAVHRLRTALTHLPLIEGESIYAFVAGELPPHLATAVTSLQMQFEGVEEAMGEAMRLLKSDKLAESLGPGAAALLPLQVSGSSLYSATRDSLKGLMKFLSPKLPVKWLDIGPAGMKLVASPLDGNEVLEGLLWKSTRAVPVMVSATIRDFKGFERFAARVGAPELRTELLVDPVLPYENARLVLPFMRNTPKQSERVGYEKELCKKLPAAIETSTGGALVLMPSFRMMEKIKAVLISKFGTAVLVQGSLPTKQLIAEHCKRIDAGRPSILIGVASLSEGLDLPGRYCSHVLIGAIPFASPVDPVERERSRQAGNKYFAKHSLPDAFVKLVQMTGRLIRREDDFGTITVFDGRLTKMGFGKQMLKALPGYQLERMPPTEEDRAILQAAEDSYLEEMGDFRHVA